MCVYSTTTSCHQALHIVVHAFGYPKQQTNTSAFCQPLLKSQAATFSPLCCRQTAITCTQLFNILWPAPRIPCPSPFYSFALAPCPLSGVRCPLSVVRCPLSLDPFPFSLAHYPSPPPIKVSGRVHQQTSPLPPGRSQANNPRPRPTRDPQRYAEPKQVQTGPPVKSAWVDEHLQPQAPKSHRGPISTRSHGRD